MWSRTTKTQWTHHCIIPWVLRVFGCCTFLFFIHFSASALLDFSCTLAGKIGISIWSPSFLDGEVPRCFLLSLNMNGPDLSGAHLASTHHTCLLPDAQTLPTCKTALLLPLKTSSPTLLLIKTSRYTALILCARHVICNNYELRTIITEVKKLGPKEIKQSYLWSPSQ